MFLSNSSAGWLTKSCKQGFCVPWGFWASLAESGQARSKKEFPSMLGALVPWAASEDPLPTFALEVLSMSWHPLPARALGWLSPEVGHGGQSGGLLFKREGRVFVWQDWELTPSGNKVSTVIYMIIKMVSTVTNRIIKRFGYDWIGYFRGLKMLFFFHVNSQ